MTPMKRRSLAAAAATTALMSLAACGTDEPADASTTTTPSAETSATAEATDGAASGGEFTAGEYEATGSYQSPAGTQSVEVEVTLAADGTISDLDVDGQAEGGNSEQYQKKFESGIDALVVGKKITELDVSKVSGSSLTSGGFNDAIDQIISQAQA